MEMSTPVRIAAFVVGLAVAFAAAVGLGRAVGPLDPETEPAMAGHESAGGEHGGEHGGHDSAATEVPGGLMVSQDGYTLSLASTTAEAGRREVGFTITDPDGHALTDYAVEHEKQLHLIAVRRDFAGFQHVHPTLGSDGTWTTDLELRPGAWRVLADFVPAGGEGLTLGADLLVSGDAPPAAPADDRRTDTPDGYTVDLAGDLESGAAADLTVRVSRDGEPVTDLEPYLGAYGHLVALREGDLAYLHVHPEDGEPGPDVPFVAEVPSAGTYRLFFDFQHDGEVRTASFVVTAGGGHEH